MIRTCQRLRSAPSSGSFGSGPPADLLIGRTAVALALAGSTCRDVAGYKWPTLVAVEL
ncbi:hypothetical protein J0H58_37410 [bacterium]|nr:hypothetical protein [bacterium]